MILVKKQPGDSPLKVFSMFNQRTRKANQKNRFKEIQISKKPLSALKKRQKAVATALFLRRKLVSDRTDRKS
jgi:hypothetical protein